MSSTRKPLFPTDNFRPAPIARFALTTLIGLGLDLWTKSLAFSRLLVEPFTFDRNHQVVVESIQPDPAIVQGWLHLHATGNQGAVFGIGQNYIWLFVVVSVVATLFLTYLFAVSGRKPLHQIVLGMLLAGVLGNMYDRVAYGFVRDMIYALPGWKWPGQWQLFAYPPARREVFPWIFNVADVLLCVGVGAMLAFSFFSKRPAAAADPDRPKPKPRGEAKNAGGATP